MKAQSSGQAITKILFVCVGNSCRSQMAEAFANHLGRSKVRAWSAGSRPLRRILSNTAEVMLEKNVSLERQWSKGLQDVPLAEIDVIVTMGCEVSCPAPAGFKGRVLEWNIFDPYGGNLEVFRSVRDEIERHVKSLVAEVTSHHPSDAMRRGVMHERADHHDAELLLRLYDLRREEKLRRAREWFVREFRAESFEDYNKRYPFGSEENVYARMVNSYWEMAASIVNRGLINEELFFENTAEFYAVWTRIKHLVPEARKAFKNPHQYENLEKLAERYEKWMIARAPEAIAAFQERINKMMAGAKA